MAVIVERKLPSVKELKAQGFPVNLSKGGGCSREDNIKIAIINLMPNKQETEKQFLRQLAQTPFNIEVKFVQLKTHKSKNTPLVYLNKFYHSFEEIKNENIDGMIITGAPIEELEFADVDYWTELTKILDYARENVSSTLMVCWGALAGLYHYHGIAKELIKKKICGIYTHTKEPSSKLFNGFEAGFGVPHSRYFQLNKTLINNLSKLQILSESEEGGIFAIASKDRKEVYVTGHLEYEVDTLKKEYFRDVRKGLIVNLPQNYFPDDHLEKCPIYAWEREAQLFFTNWIQYFVKPNNDGEG